MTVIDSGDVNSCVAMIYRLNEAQCRNFDLSSRREWLLTNGLGGFAMGTASGANQRRYHGHLIAAEPAPAVRTVLLSGIEAFVQGEHVPIGISSNQYQGTVHPDGFHHLVSFEVGRFARWEFAVENMRVEKRLAVHQGENATTIAYRNLGKVPFQLSLKPLVCHKFYHDVFRFDPGYPQVQAYPQNQTIIEHGGLPLVLSHPGAERQPAVGWYYRFEHLREIDRGLDGKGDLFCPCELHYLLKPGEEANIVASLSGTTLPIETWEMGEREGDIGESLRESAEKFFVSAQNRTSIIAGYPWFTDWGRDTMIAIPGLCLTTDRAETARNIITDYGNCLNQGLIPNRFPDQGDQPEYNTVDATLWYANSIYRVLQAEWCETFAKECLDRLLEIMEWHNEGTLYNIKVDPEDGLLSQGEQGVQLTWMDAKIGDWVVTPRHGKPVEINALWINLLEVVRWLGAKLRQEVPSLDGQIERARTSFEEKFWYKQRNIYLDTVEPDDASIRPNMVLAMSLPFSPCSEEHIRAALKVVSTELLTPFGLRTLAVGNANYKGRFRGPLPELDAAYHQGTVWPWLIGAYVDAALKVGVPKSDLRRLLKNAREMHKEYGLGGIAEVYDGDEPRNGGGCPWQVWSSAEWLRAWALVEE